jgi:hypothetical protein
MRGGTGSSTGELLKATETAGFEVLITTDKNKVSQQNLRTRTIPSRSIANVTRPGNNPNFYPRHKSSLQKSWLLHQGEVAYSFSHRLFASIFPSLC